MLKSIHVGFRLHPIKDKDIIEDLERYRNMTDRWKEVYRMVLAYQAVPTVPQTTYIPVMEPTHPIEAPSMQERHSVQPNQPVQTEQPKQAQKEQPLDWSHIPVEPTITAVKPSTEKADAIKQKILNTDFS